MANDYPDGFRRLLPGHTVDLTSGFARPWYMGDTLNIAAGNYSTYTINITDPDSIYYIDVVNVSPQSYTEFGVRVFINSIPYVAEGCIGFAHIPMRVNPSLLLIYGDVIVVEVTNYDASLRQFLVKVHGTKISRPDGFGHVPGAYFTASAHVCDVCIPVLLSDASSFSPTSWSWDLKNGYTDVALQNPWAWYQFPGSYYPRLKAINAYGYDTYAEQVPIVCNAVLYPPGWNEVDPGSHVTVGDDYVTVTALPSNVPAMVYASFVDRWITSYRVRFKFECSLLQADSWHGVFGFSNSFTSLDLESSSYVSINVNYSGGHSYMILRYYYLTGEVIDTHVDFPVDGTPRYLDLHHPSQSDTVSLKIYSNSAMTSLVDTLSITHSALKSSYFGYCYLVRGLTGGSVATKTIKISNIQFQYG
jgi:PKD repeat protein